MVKRLVIAALALVLVGGGLVGFNLFRDRMIANIFANMPQQPATVSAMVVAPVTWSPTLDSIGTVNAAQGVELTVESAGVVKDILFAPNADVTAGAVLVRLEDAVQAADAEAARTAEGLARSNLERAKGLAGRGVSTDAALDQTQAAAEAAAAQLARAEALLEQRQLTAPFDGTIGIARVTVGQYVTPGVSVATLQDLSQMRVDFNLPERDVPKLSIGQKVEVRAEGQDTPGTGTISGIDPRVDPGTRLVAVRAEIAPMGQGLLPGQFVRVRVALPVETGVIALPQTAIASSLYGDYVYVLRPKKGAGDQLEVRQVFVVPGRRAGGLVEVLRGLTVGDQVVTAGQNRLSNGQPAVVDNTIDPTRLSGGGGAHDEAAPDLPSAGEAEE